MIKKFDFDQFFVILGQEIHSYLHREIKKTLDDLDVQDLSFLNENTSYLMFNEQTRDLTFAISEIEGMLYCIDVFPNMFKKMILDMKKDNSENFNEFNFIASELELVFYGFKKLNHISQVTSYQAPYTLDANGNSYQFSEWYTHLCPFISNYDTYIYNCVLRSYIEEEVPA